MYPNKPLPEAIAHRGLRATHPENSLPAFEAALLAGADGIELDVHASSDGHVVVHHDFNVIWDGNATPIAALDRDAISRVRLDGDVHIPTLDETLEFIRERCTVYIEIKARGIEEDVVRCLRRHEHYANHYAVHSFDHRIVRKMLALMPSIRTGILQVGYPVDSVAAMRAAGASDLWPQADFLDATLVADVHTRRGRVIAWTVNEPGDWKRLAEVGVDCICTDKVDEYLTWRSAQVPPGP